MKWKMDPNVHPIVPRDGFWMRIRRYTNLGVDYFRANRGGWQDKGRFVANATAHTVREYPFHALATAAATGLVIGILLGSGKSSSK